MQEGAKRAGRSPARIVCVGLALAALVLRLVVAFRNLDVVDRFFVPDDTYYTLGIARSMARGLGPTVDGVHLTNGFQPLLAFLVTPVCWLTRDPDVPLRATLVLLSFVDAALVLALAALARLVAPKRPHLAAITAAAIWTFSPLAISYALGGLETSLALLMSALLVLAWAHARDTGKARHFALAGVVAGLSLLARIDTVFLVGALGAFELVRGRRAGALVAAGAALVTVAPWWGYELLRFHTVIPLSGEAVRAQAAVHQSLYLTVPKQLGVALGAVLEAPIGRPFSLRRFFLDQTSVALVLTAVVVLLIGAGIRRSGRSQAATAPVRILLAFGLVVWFFYALHVPALWFFPRYLAPTHLALTLLLASGVATLAAEPASTGRRRAAVLAFVVVVIAPAARTFHYVTFTPDGTEDVGVEGAKGYREPVRALLALTPRGAVVGALQSGALGYYALTSDRGVTVVNLDGVVDEEAARAFRARDLAAFARSRRVTHLADWKWNLEAFIDHGGDARLSAASYREVARVRAQGTDQLTLQEIRWPEGP